MATRREQREQFRREREEREKAARETDQPIYAGLPVISTDNLPTGEWVTARKTTLVRAIKMDAPFICYTIDGNMAQGQAGDYVMVDEHGFPYPCHAKVFEASYEEVKNGTSE